MDIVQNRITNHYTPGRNGWNLDFIVLHTYDGKGTSLWNWFQNLSPNTSSHFSVWKDGTVEQYVDLDDTAHHAGDQIANYRSVGIEHQDDGDPYDSVRTDALYESSAQLCAHIYRLRGWDISSMDNIKTHHDFTGGECPAGLDVGRIRRRTYEILNYQDWIKLAIDIPDVSYKPEKEYNLYNIDTGEIVRTYPANTSVGIAWEYQGFLITQYSYNARIKNGFKKEELAFKAPVEIPETPTVPADVDVNFYHIILYKPGGESYTFADIEKKEEAMETFSNTKKVLIPGEKIELREVNETKNTSILVDSYEQPIMKPNYSVETLSERLQNSFSYAVPVQLLTSALGIIIADRNPGMDVEVVFAYTTIFGVALNITYSVARFIGSKIEKKLS